MEIKFEILTIISLFSLTIAFLSAIVASYAAVKVVAMEKSTHSVQYMPIDPEIDMQNQSLMNTQDWATSEESIEKQRKLFNKDLEDNMPEFHEDEDDMKRFTF